MRVLALACVGMLPCLTACGDGVSSPIGPALIQAPASPSPDAPRASVAKLELVNGSVLGYPGGYSVAFLLKETSGQSGAVIRSVHVADDAGVVTVSDASCWGSNVVIRVPPGGTLADFDRPFTSQALSPDPYTYCGAYSSGPPTTQLRVTVIFADDFVATGTVTARIPTS